MIVGISGKARSGKDTAAEYLVKRYGFRRIAFADRLKEVCRVAFGFSYDQVYGDEKLVVDPYWGNTPVHYLQQVGTELFREHIDPDFWVKSAFRVIDSSDLGMNDRWVFSDLRFPNEAEAVKARGGLLIRIERGNRPSTQRNDGHASEVALDGYEGWDRIIYNNGTLADLYREVDRALVGSGVVFTDQ